MHLNANWQMMRSQPSQNLEAQTWDREMRPNLTPKTQKAVCGGRVGLWQQALGGGGPTPPAARGAAPTSWAGTRGLPAAASSAWEVDTTLWRQATPWWGGASNKSPEGSRQAVPLIPNEGHPKRPWVIGIPPVSRSGLQNNFVSEKFLLSQKNSLVPSAAKL